MKVLVTGATGFVGAELLKHLQAAGHSIGILTRRTMPPAVRLPSHQTSLHLFPGDILDPETLPAALKNMDAVIHLVGIISEYGRQTFQNIHVRGTANLVEAARAAGVRRFVHMSALGTRPNARARYHQTKWTAEEAVRRSNLDFTIFRPSLIYGPGDHFVNLFAKIIRFSPAIPVFGKRDALFQPIALEAVAQAFALSLEEPRSIGQTYDLCGPERFTLAQLINEILCVMHKKRLLLKVPRPLARLQAAILELVFGRVLMTSPPLNRDQLLMLEEDNVGDPVPADALFALREMTFRAGIAKYLR